MTEQVEPEGLLEYPNFPKVFYHPAKLDVLEHRLAVLMPGFREWIGENKQNEFWAGLRRAGLTSGGVLLAAKALEEKK